eukprot:NODE_6254_length_463_cov_15.468599_g4740_i0.p5 GENE.NODE_6254_length_463_cov_15.468599_g4740_i0~~NODE_6254_length_463_cov_15.468599_g4740_i0.p5  ORF type:complete len:57 (-),score=1.34 NODE_6254_length_463_cov_15.468599_g4740_i0:175-345(-)
MHRQRWKWFTSGNVRARVREKKGGWAHSLAAEGRTNNVQRWKTSQQLKTNVGAFGG